MRAMKWLFLLQLFLTQQVLVNSSSSSDNKKGAVSMGTTIVALKTQEGVVIGADSRTSVSSRVVSNRYARKLSVITAGCVIGRSGSAADTQYLVDEARWEFRSRSCHDASFGSHHSKLSYPSPAQIAHFMRYLMVEKLQQQQDIMASLICAGLDSTAGRIYCIAPSGALWEEPIYAVSGSGSSFIVGYLDQQCSSKGSLFTEKEAIPIVIQALRLAMTRDGSSGGICRVMVLNQPNENNTNNTRTQIQEILIDGDGTALFNSSETTTNMTKTSLSVPEQSKSLAGFAMPLPFTRRSS